MGKHEGFVRLHAFLLIIFAVCMMMGVVCPASCPPNQYLNASDASSGCYPMHEWNCSADPYSGVGWYKLSRNCTISGSSHLKVTEKLNITGTNTNMLNLVTVANGLHYHGHGKLQTIVIE